MAQAEKLNAPATTTGPRWFDGLDGLRALAAFLIVLHHAGFASGLTFTSDWVGPFLARMEIGVPVFFLLSGFLLFRPFVAAQFAGERPSDVVGFWLRRLVRIFPAYWLAYFVLLAVGAISVVGIAGYPANGLLAHIYRPLWVKSGITQSWSLGTEISFYLVLPGLALIGARLGAGRSINRQAIRLLTFCAGLAALSLVFRLGMHMVSPYWANSYGAVSRLWLPSYLDVFGTGMGLAVLSAWAEHRSLVAGYLASITRRVWPWYLAALVMYWMVCTQLELGRGLEMGTFPMEVARQTFYLGVALAMVFPVIFADPQRSLIVRFFCHPVMAFLGSISYGVYLWHQAFLTWIRQILDWPEFQANFLVLVAGASLGSAAVAYVSFRLLEQPLMAKVRRWLAARS
jgi:peptidoglycan/LPS O-acetylase OafA/YrhL